jgi:uncharacterized protein YoxC
VVEQVNSISKALSSMSEDKKQSEPEVQLPSAESESIMSKLNYLAERAKENHSNVESLTYEN